MFAEQSCRQRRRMIKNYRWDKKLQLCGSVLHIFDREAYKFSEFWCFAWTFSKNKVYNSNFTFADKKFADKKKTFWRFCRQPTT